ncbi:N-formylglutamate amidohydrolase [Pseudooceanicola sp. C21-150M6]|uniref:N-formylglutamate amidohydrolase n=1 Tax=Pseudooceanicola sp. C21-150M6 TaxID=3434355 RepID=UPI003D7F95FB
MTTVGSPLLSKADPAPVERIEGTGGLPALLVCEHAGQAVPEGLTSLGLAPDVFDLHIGWDIGAAAVTRLMAAELGCTAVLQRYSRLVIDCNRPTQAPDAIPPVSDGVAVPGNMGLNAADRSRRIEAIFAPFHAAVLAARAAGPQMILAIHSFTPEMASRPGPRPWHVGFLGRRDMATSEALMDAVASERPDLSLALNEPYQVDDESDWFVPAHGEPSGLPHSLIEIRHDLIRTPEGQSEYAGLLSRAVRHLLEKTPC